MKHLETISIFRGPAKITQRFAQRPVYYQQFGLLAHEGWDMIPEGEDWTVISRWDGEVILDDDSGSRQAAYGNQVRILTDQNFVIAFCHLDENFVSIGQRVKAGDPIGVMGNSGNSTGAHVHLMGYPLDKQGNRMFPDNGYFGCIDPAAFMVRYK